MFLLDTMVISETVKRSGNVQVLEWLGEQQPDSFYLSVVTLGEIERGIAANAARNPQYAIALREWSGRIEERLQNRILVIDPPTARCRGELSARLGHREPDLFLAATALVHSLTVVTRNVRHFARTGVPVLNLYEERA